MPDRGALARPARRVAPDGRVAGGAANHRGWVRNPFRLPTAIGAAVPRGGQRPRVRHARHVAPPGHRRGGVGRRGLAVLLPRHVVAKVEVIPKSTPGKFRFIVDLWASISTCVGGSSTTSRWVCSAAGCGKVMVLRDLESGYYHFSVAEADRSFLGFRLWGKYYVFSVLPFGLRDACSGFTLVMAVPVIHRRSLGATSSSGSVSSSACRSLSSRPRGASSRSASWSNRSSARSRSSRRAPPSSWRSPPS